MEFPYEDFLCDRNCCKYFGPEGVRDFWNTDKPRVHHCLLLLLLLLFCFCFFGTLECFSSSTAHLPPSTDCGKNRRNNHHHRKNRVNPKPSQQQQQSPPSSFFQSPPTTTTPPPQQSPTSTLEPITNYPTFFWDVPTFHKPITNYPTFVPRVPSPPPPSPPSSTSTPNTTPTTNTATTTMPSFSDLVPTRTLVPQPGRQEEQHSDSPSHVPLFTMSKRSIHQATTTTTARPSPSGSSNGKKKSKRMEPLSLGPTTSTIHPSSFPVASCKAASSYKAVVAFSISRLFISILCVVSV